MIRKKRHGGRWNAIGSFRAVYGSSVDIVAVAESRATADYARISLPFVTPRLLVAIEVALETVLDADARFDSRATRYYVG
jgi:RES domain-containing protein